MASKRAAPVISWGSSSRRWIRKLRRQGRFGFENSGRKERLSTKVGVGTPAIAAKSLLRAIASMCWPTGTPGPRMTIGTRMSAS